MNMPRKNTAFGTVFIFLVLACSDNTGPGNRPHAIEIVSGDGQGVLPGDMAPEPLRVRVIGSDGQPLAGATVAWAVTSGDATLESAQSRTDARGEADTRVTITGRNAVEVRATVGGLSPVTFSIPVLDPCSISSARPIALEAAVTGTLQELDCEFDDGSFFDLYAFRLNSQELVTLRLRAPTFDPIFFLFARAPNGGYFDRGGVVDTVDASRVAVGRWILPAGDYIVTPNSVEGSVTGTYELLLSASSAAPQGCEQVWVMLGVTTAQTLAATDCTDSPGPFHRDVFLLVLWAGERVTLTHSSGAFAPRLRLLRRTGDLITEADGSATGTALINFTSDETSLYLVHATSAEPGRTGPYTLAVIAPAPGASASSSSAPIGSRRQTSPSPQRTRGLRPEQ